MTLRVARDPSPVRSGLVHGSLGILSLCVLFAGGGAGLHVFGDADAAGPRVQVALFEPADADRPDLKARLADTAMLDPSMPGGAAQTETSAQLADEAPDLGVEYRGAVAPQKQPSTIRTITINGQVVPIGKSLSQVRASTEASTPATAATAAQEKPAPDTPFEKYARPFENPENKPTVSVVLGGLGINWRHTEAAIKELPPEITLSFAPSARNLKRYVREARAMGHEVLIELPMEPYDYGRDRPHQNILQVAAGTQTNSTRLKRLLSQVRGYMGVTNYQGGKFATSKEAASPIFNMLAERGIAFFEDGSLSKSVFEETANTAGLTFASADLVLDARTDAEDIERQLLALEAEALENGHALGSSFAYPVTIDMLKAWGGRIQQKGILLAPASYHAKQQVTSGQAASPVLDQAG